MFDRTGQHQNKLISLPYLVSIAAAFGVGYYCAKKEYFHEDLAVTVVENSAINTTATGHGPQPQQSQLLVSYQRTPPRIIFAQDGVTKVGTLPQRLDDLLNEDPQQIHLLAKELLSRQASRP